MLFVLHADHEQNCSTSTVRLVGSAQANLYASVSAGINALSGPLHGGANAAVLEMLEQIRKRRRRRRHLRQPGEEQGKGRQADGLRPPGLQELRPARRHREEGRPGHAVQDGQAGPAAGDRVPARGDRAGRRLLRLPQALPERRLLHRPDLQGDGLPDEDVHGAVRARPAARLDRPVARDDDRPDHQDRPSAPALHRARRSASSSRSTSGEPGRSTQRCPPTRRCTARTGGVSVRRREPRRDPGGAVLVRQAGGERLGAGAPVRVRGDLAQAAARRSAVRLDSGIGADAAPRRCRRSAQNGWSARTGTGTAGTPARRPAAVVPAPAWWTTAAIRGNSQSCGASPMVSTSSDVDVAGRPSPAWTTARTPAPGGSPSRTGPAQPFALAGAHAAEADEHRRRRRRPGSRVSSAGGCQAAAGAGHQ